MYKIYVSFKQNNKANCEMPKLNMLQKSKIKKIRKIYLFYVLIMMLFSNKIFFNNSYLNCIYLRYRFFIWMWSCTYDPVINQKIKKKKVITVFIHEPCTQGELSHAWIFVWQISPIKPVKQLHEKPKRPSIHWPLFLHGILAQKFTLFSQFFPK